MMDGRIKAIKDELKLIGVGNKVGGNGQRSVDILNEMTIIYVRCR